MWRDQGALGIEGLGDFQDPKGGGKGMVCWWPFWEVIFLTSVPGLPDPPLGSSHWCPSYSSFTLGHTHRISKPLSLSNSPQEEDRDNTNFSAIVSGLKNLSSPGKEPGGPIWAGSYVGEEQEQERRVPASLPPSRDLCESDVHLPAGFSAAKCFGALALLPILRVSDHAGL